MTTISPPSRNKSITFDGDHYPADRIPEENTKDSQCFKRNVELYFQHDILNQTIKEIFERLKLFGQVIEILEKSEGKNPYLQEACKFLVYKQDDIGCVVMLQPPRIKLTVFQQAMEELEKTATQENPKDKRFPMICHQLLLDENLRTAVSRIRHLRFVTSTASFGQMLENIMPRPDNCSSTSSPISSSSSSSRSTSVESDLELEKECRMLEQAFRQSFKGNHSYPAYTPFPTVSSSSSSSSSTSFPPTDLELEKECRMLEQDFRQSFKGNHSYPAYTPFPTVSSSSSSSRYTSNEHDFKERRKKKSDVASSSSSSSNCIIG